MISTPINSIFQAPRQVRPHVTIPVPVFFEAIAQRTMPHSMESEAAVSRDIGGVMAEDYG
jgi:hypothetical protein